MQRGAAGCGCRGLQSSGAAAVTAAAQSRCLPVKARTLMQRLDCSAEGQGPNQGHNSKTQRLQKWPAPQGASLICHAGQRRRDRLLHIPLHPQHALGCLQKRQSPQ